ncbi:hypothetical protein RSOL_350300, partial [Rhizoctonia solani AG-3 Rhs1AP]
MRLQRLDKKAQNDRHRTAEDLAAQQVKKHQDAQTRGKASAIARAAKAAAAAGMEAQAEGHIEGRIASEARVEARVEGCVEARVEARIEAPINTPVNTTIFDGPQDLPVLRMPDALDDPLAAIVNDLSSMSICLPTDGDSDMEDDDRELGTFTLPAEIVTPPPPTQMPVVLSQAQPQESSALNAPPPSKLEQDSTALQATLLSLAALPPAKRAQLPENIRQLLAIFDTTSAVGTTPAPNHALSSVQPSHTVSTTITSGIFPSGTPPTGAPRSTPALAITQASLSKVATRPRMRPPPVSPPAPQSGTASTPSPMTTNASNSAASAPVPRVLSSTVIASTSVPQGTKFLTMSQIEPGPATLEVDDDSLSELSDASELDQPDISSNVTGMSNGTVKGKAKAAGVETKGKDTAPKTRGKGRGAKLDNHVEQARANGRVTRSKKKA